MDMTELDQRLVLEIGESYDEHPSIKSNIT